MAIELKIEGDFIKLDSLLKYANLVETGGSAKNLIQDGQVTVNGEIETRRGKKIYPGDEVSLEGEVIKVI